MMPVPWKLWEGQVVDLSFPLRRYLGGTDQSAVYLTQFGDPEPRDAAIKLVLETNEGEPEFPWERIAQLSHPNLLRLVRTGTWQVNRLSLRYAVTEYAEENLAAVLTERPLAVAEVREMLGPLLDALAYIHAEGLVHGHVKPANIMAIGDDLKLSIDGLSLVGEPGVTTGSPGPYDPPELQERGCSPVGDVWSFGVTLVEALTQQLPTSTGPRLDPVLPSNLPSEFLPMVRACLHPDPRRRASLEEIRRQFNPAAPKVPEPVVLRQVIVEPPQAPRKRMSLVWVGVAAVALGVILTAPLLKHDTPPPAAPPSVVSSPPKENPPVVQAAELPPVETPKPAKPEPAVSETPKVSVHKTAPVPAPPTASTGSTAVVHEVLPEISDQARKTIHGKVRIIVRATVDAAGQVTNTELESHGSAYFSKLVMSAARQWTFEPSDGASDWLLRFDLTAAGTTTQSSRVKPGSKQ